MNDINEHPEDHAEDIDNSAPLSGIVLSSPEGRLLITGIMGAFLYFIWMGFQLILSPVEFQALVGLTATEVVFGRIACMAFGYSLNLNPITIILVCMILETILVLIFYPLLVFIWRHLLVVRWLKRFSDRTRKAAETHKDIVSKYGIIGLFLFVWLPFWMTGPVVGCMIGYLLGLRVRINIPTVLTGTYAAILGWAFLLKHLHRKMMSYSAYTLIILATLAIIAALVWILKKNIGDNRKK